MPSEETDQLYHAAVAHHRAGRHTQAEALYRQVLQSDPGRADAVNSLGILAESAGRGDDAIELIKSAIRINPEQPGYHLNLGIVLAGQRRMPEAADAFAAAVRLDPGDFHAATNLGNALYETGDSVRAIAAWREVLKLQPDNAEVANNLGLALWESGRLDEAIAAFGQATAPPRELASAWSNLARILLETGQLDESLSSFRRAIDLGAGPRTASNLLYSLHFNPGFDPRQVLQEHAKWNELFARPLSEPHRKYPNDLVPDRRLRIGYVSANFRNHPVGRFMLPICRHHDRRQFEIFFYDDLTETDPVTRQLQALADAWRPTAGLSDEQLAALIANDRIDILVDLNKHMDGTRLLAFAPRPAPVQATYLAYPGTTGLESIDYRLTDPFLDPPQSDPIAYSERSICLPRSHWCYPTPDDAPEVGPLPASVNGYITYGCLNRFSKLNEAVIELWGAILRRTPNSRLVLHAPEGNHRQTVVNQLSQERVAADRVAFVARAPSREYFARYCRIDIALDPFPGTGVATTCDALWMGVPVVTLAGTGATARAGVSLLANASLPALIAPGRSEYLQLATALASDLPRLAALRGRLRPMMRASGLMDGQRMARDIEAAFRRMWTRFLLDGGATSSSQAWHPAEP